MQQSANDSRSSGCGVSGGSGGGDGAVGTCGGAGGGAGAGAATGGWQLILTAVILELAVVAAVAVVSSPASSSIAWGDSSIRLFLLL